MENEKIFEFMEKMYADLKGDINGLKEGQSRIELKVDGLEDEVKKNSISLESIETKINIIAEVQTAHKEQTERTSHNTDAMVSENFDLIETALKSATSEIKEINESLDFVKHKETKNEEELYKIKKNLTIIK